MTTSRRAGKPAAGEEPARPRTAPGGTAPGDEHELRQEIEQTREQLGETVEQLVAKTDVTGRARAKAAELADRVKDSTAQVRAKAARRAADVRSQASGKTELARHKTTAGRDRLQARAAGAWQAAPEGARRTVAKAADIAGQRRVPLAVAAAVLAAGYLAFRWRRRR
jgi:polyhydroxyalkanoate synthesis regulator phasin